MRRRTAFPLRWALSGLLACVLGAELLCRLLPVSTATLTGYHLDPRILSYPPGHAWTVATGWDLRNAQRLVANNAGFAADRDFAADANAVALIGDSFVEASMLPAGERPGAQLERALGGGRPVYAMGGPGSSLLDYAERIRWAHERWGVRDFVLLVERGDVRQALCGSGNVHAACLDPQTLAPRWQTQPAAGSAKRWLRHSALAQYLFSQLKLSADGLWRQALAQSRPPEPPAAPAAAPGATGPRALDARSAQEIDAVLALFFERVKPHVGGRLVLVVDADRERLRLGQPIDDPARRRLIERAHAAGATVVDTEPLFAAHHAGSARRLDVGPYDRHLNGLAIGLAMDAAAQALQAAR